MADLRLLELVPTLSDVGRHPEISMAAYRPEVVITRERYEISKATPTFSTMADSLDLVPTLSNVGRQPEIAISAYKPEVVTTQERYEISVRFQRI